MSVVSYVAFVLSLFISNLFFFVVSGRLIFMTVVFPGYITKTCLFTYIENFPSKIESFHIKNSVTFYISAQNKDFGYSLEPPQRGDSNVCPQSTVWLQSMFLSGKKKK